MRILEIKTIDFMDPNVPLETKKRIWPERFQTKTPPTPSNADFYDFHRYLSDKKAARRA